MSWANCVRVICHDQEPLNWSQFDLSWQECKEQWMLRPPWCNISVPDNFWQKASALNLSFHLMGNFYDRGVLVHSELRSNEVKKYADYFIPVYYWSHAIIARDWFRFANNDPKLSFTDTQYEYDFNVYARAWQGTREYRLAFLKSLQESYLLDRCRITFSSYDGNIYYRDHDFSNSDFSIGHDLKIPDTPTPSTYSAEYDTNHYKSCAFDCVLETLFDDHRLHLTEKTLRPIACGKPFLLMATHGSLDFLRQYGFRTFSPWLDETYDNIESPLHRMQAIVQEMNRVKRMSSTEKQKLIKHCHDIAIYNKKHFFSDEFANHLSNELQTHLKSAIKKIKNHHRNGHYCRLLVESLDKKTQTALINSIGCDQTLVYSSLEEFGLWQR